MMTGTWKKIFSCIRNDSNPHVTYIAIVFHDRCEVRFETIQTDTADEGTGTAATIKKLSGD